jgi:hypothetical protein
MKGATVQAVVLLAIAAGGVAATQPRLAREAHALRERDLDLYVFPPPVQLHAATLGWDAAAVDLLWAKLLVEYGTHWSEHREFIDVPKYVDAILELEPTYWPVYRFVDTMLAYRPLQGTEDDVRRARQYLERGTRTRPDDWRVWMEYGQFLAFIAPSFLHDREEMDAWRKDGAYAIGRSVELGASAEGVLSASTMLTRAGARDQALGYLRHAYAFTQHPAMAEVHEAIGRKLAALQAGAFRDEADRAARAVRTRQRRELPFLPLDTYLLIGPVVDPARCDGTTAFDTPACAGDWPSIVEEGALHGMAEEDSDEDSP